MRYSVRFVCAGINARAINDTNAEARIYYKNNCVLRTYSWDQLQIACFFVGLLAALAGL
jgi:hypothetical protein